MRELGRFGLSQTTLDKLTGVFARHAAIEEVWIYGSRAKGNYRPGSDIDLTIKGTALTINEFARLQDELDELLLPYTIDLSQYRNLDNPDLIAHIDRVGTVLYAMNKP